MASYAVLTCCSRAAHVLLTCIGHLQAPLRTYRHLCLRRPMQPAIVVPFLCLVVQLHASDHLPGTSLKTEH